MDVINYLGRHKSLSKMYKEINARDYVVYQVWRRKSRFEFKSLYWFYVWFKDVYKDVYPLSITK